MLYLMALYKRFLADEAEQSGVSQGTVRRWLDHKRYGHLVFHRTAQRIYVSGTTIPMGKRPCPCRYDYSSVDWLKNNMQIARELGCNNSTVFYHRKKHMTRTLRIRKLANAIKDYRGATHPQTGKWIRDPKPSAIERVKEWLTKLGRKDIQADIATIDAFKTWDDMQIFLKTL